MDEMWLFVMLCTVFLVVMCTYNTSVDNCMCVLRTLLRPLTFIYFHKVL